jgi:hypothetical protein
LHHPEKKTTKTTHHLEDAEKQSVLHPFPSPPWRPKRNITGTPGRIIVEKHHHLASSPRLHGLPKEVA